MKIAVISGSEKSGTSFIATNLASVGNYAYFDCDFINPKANFYFEENNATPTEHYEDVFDLNSITFNNSTCCVSANTSKNLFIGNEFSYSNEKVKVYYGKTSNVNFRKELFDKILEQNELTNVYFDLPGKITDFTLHAVKNADYCLIVTEPTALNFDEFKGCLRAVKLLSKPYGIVFNKTTLLPQQFEDYCYQVNANVLASFPTYLKEEKLISDCKILSRLKLTHKQAFLALHQQLKKK